MKQPDCIKFGRKTFKENHPFRPVNSCNDSLAENYTLFPSVLFLGQNGDPAFKPFDICVVTGPDQDCSTAVRSDCFRRDFNSPTEFMLSSHDGEAACIVSAIEDGQEGVFQGTPGELISAGTSAGGADELFNMESSPID
ncbi:hypothetical protein BGZ82_000186 [Podila clonocystis]|nr:hypothetical protein BGZ82_000186 [Podila clonocystis]